MTLALNISKDFSRYPGPRHRSDGRFSGEDFRDEILLPRVRDAIQRNEKLVIILDGVRGYTASFLEEAFGGLIRIGAVDKQDVKRVISIEAADPRLAYWRENIEKYIDEAQAAAKG